MKRKKNFATTVLWGSRVLRETTRRAILLSVENLRSVTDELVAKPGRLTILFIAFAVCACQDTVPADRPTGDSQTPGDAGDAGRPSPDAQDDAGGPPPAAQGDAENTPGGGGAIDAPETPLPRLRVSFMSGFRSEAPYDSDQLLRLFMDELEAHHNVDGSWIRGDEKAETTLEGLDSLEDADLLVVLARRMVIPVRQLETIRRYIADGGPVVGIRAASHGFNNWTQFDSEVLGGDYSGVAWRTPTTVSIAPDEAKHPVLEGVEGYASSSGAYNNPDLAADVQVLMTGAETGGNSDDTKPMTWVRELATGNRVFYTVLSHRDDWSNPTFMKLMVNAVNWTTRRSKD